MNRAPRVVIPPPHGNAKIALCAGGNSAHPSAQSTHSEKAVFSAEINPARGLFRHSHSGQRVVIPPPRRSVEKMQNRSFYHRPQQGSRRNPAKRFRWEEDERQRERVLTLAAGRGIRRPLGRQPASHLSGLRRSRCPAKCTERAKPCTQFPGGSPDPPSCERFCGNAFTRLRRRSFKGGPVPL